MTSRFAVLAVVALLTGVSAASAANSVTDQDPQAAQPSAPSSIEEAAAPFEINAQIRDWAREKVGRRGSREQRLVRLLDALVSDPGLDITYTAGYTGTAEEVFETREANCLAFTHLFVGLARELGIDVEYLRVHDVQTVERHGIFVVVSGHISAGYNTGPEYRVLDFSDLPIDEYRHVEPMRDHSVVALHHINRGAELMLEGRWEEAEPWLDLGVQLDPELPEAWVNLGVYRRHQGRLEDAEAAYRRAIEIAPEFPASYQNLAALLMPQPHRRDEALALLDLATQNKTRNPYLFLTLGDLARSQGRPDVAGDYYKRALALAPDEAEVLAALGLWADEVDKPRKARRFLRKAKKADPEHPRVRALESRL